MKLAFDASQVAPNAAFEPLPTGWYPAIIEESEMKPTSAGDGHYLNLKFNVIDGQFAGRKFFDRLNLHNKNPVASEIAYKTLSAICHATSRIQIQDSQELHNLPMMVRLVVKPAQDGYDANNEVKGYKSINAAVQGAAVGPGVGAPPAGFGGAAPQTQAAPQQAWQQPQQQQPVQQAWQQQPAPVQQQPQGGQPWAQQAAPVQQPVQQAPVQNQPVQGGWQQPQYQGQPVQQAAPVQQQQPVQQPVQQQQPVQAAPAGNLPPWAQPRQ